MHRSLLVNVLTFLGDRYFLNAPRGNGEGKEGIMNVESDTQSLTESANSGLWSGIVRLLPRGTFFLRLFRSPFENENHLISPQYGISMGELEEQNNF